MNTSESLHDDILSFCVNNDMNKIISSPKNLEGFCCLGIDEAGRGPVLGPMVYAGAYTEIKNLDRFGKIGLDDSKKLTERIRDKLLVSLTDDSNKICGYEIEIISPNYISNEMLNINKTNLNTISHNSAINIIRRVIQKGVKLREVYLDTVGPADKYQQLIQSYFPDLKVVVESKADSKYAVVSAASIFAKTSRDKCIVEWKHREASLSKRQCPKDCGSGYPGDPNTKEYLKSILDPIFGFPIFVRASWSTAYNIMAEKCLPIEWDDKNRMNLDENTSGNKRSRSGQYINNNTSVIDQYITQKSKRTQFYTSRKMESVVTL